METLRTLLTPFQNPVKAFEILTRKTKDLLLWDYLYHRLREPKVRSFVPMDDAMKARILLSLRGAGVRVVPYRIDLERYRDFRARAQYDSRPHYYRGRFRAYLEEKSLEHYVAADLLALTTNDVYIDVGSADSPTCEIYRDLYGCRVFRQDLTFPDETTNDTIGGDAAAMPVENAFATKMALHCSFEHFERDSDTRFVREAARVLRSGGRLVILPLYLSTTYSIQTDPSTLPLRGAQFEEDAVLYCAKGFGNRHARFYDVPHFITRIVHHLDGLELTVYDIQNATEVHPSCYLRMAALIGKT